MLASLQERIAITMERVAQACAVSGREVVTSRLSR